MEIKTKNKFMVIAQYSGQPLECIIKTGDHWQQRSFFQEVKIEGVVVTGKSFPYSRLVSFSECKLILKPLSAISDEDAIELVKLCGMEPAEIHVMEYGLEIKGGGKYRCITNRESDRGYVDYIIGQFLQSKGYDLPNYLLGEKTLKEAGLAVYE